MDREQLVAFERIVRVGTFSGAAADLGIAQPTISARIRTLEATVGADLFVRSGRQIALTEAGRALLPYARRIVDLFDEGLAAVQALAAGYAHEQIDFGLLDSLGDGFVNRSVARFLDVHAGVGLRVQTGTQQQLLDALGDGTLRLALLDWPLVQQGIDVVARLRVRLVPLALPSHPLARQGTVMFAELVARANPLFLVAWTATLAEAVRQQSAPGGVVEVPPPMARRLLRRRSGATWLPLDSVASDLDRGALVELILSDREPFYRELVLAQPQGGGLPSAQVQAFTEELLAAAREMME